MYYAEKSGRVQPETFMTEYSICILQSLSRLTKLQINRKPLTSFQQRLGSFSGGIKSIESFEQYALIFNCSKHLVVATGFSVIFCHTVSTWLRILTYFWHMCIIFCHIPYGKFTTYVTILSRCQPIHRIGHLGITWG